jgi:large conductance mechanosensitive channel
MMKVIIEFKEFIKEYKILALAIAFILGSAAISLIKSLVDNIIMPILTFFIPNGAWQTATLRIGSIFLGLGAFLGQVINFAIIALLVFLVAKFAMREDKSKKKK